MAQYIMSLSMWSAYSTCLLSWNERRTYLTEIEDPLYAYLPRFDASVPVSVILYSCVGLFAGSWGQWSPSDAAWTINVLLLSRSVILYLHPFKGHRSMIPLRDPLIDRVSGDPLRNDLSFSGHVSFLVALGLLLPPYRVVFWSCALITSVCLSCARVHYTADCVIAPLFSLYAHQIHGSIRLAAETHVPTWLMYMVSVVFAGAAVNELKMRLKSL